MSLGIDAQAPAAQGQATARFLTLWRQQALRSCCVVFDKGQPAET